jgi:uncharacterized protein (TIGR03084 family)
VVTTSDSAVAAGVVPGDPIDKPDVSSLLADLADERSALRELVEALDPSGWARPSSSGWTVRDQIAHLAFYDRAATLSLGDAAAFAERRREALADTAAFEAHHLRAFPADGRATLQAWDSEATAFAHAVRRANPAGRVPWFGPDMGLLSMVSARLMETWAHGTDVAYALGAALAPSGRLRHVATLAARARGQGYAVRGLAAPADPVRVELTAPNGEGIWGFGPAGAPDRIQGEAVEFCLVLTRRRHVDDTNLRWRGSAAREWLEIGQAFAGPPGPDPLRRNTTEFTVRRRSETWDA